MRKVIIVLLILSTAVQGQQNLPQDYFDNPLKIPLILSGSFGELRSNHFHSGLDIKTQRVEGIPIYAPADGYVSRIKVAHYGYGKALYIKHPNGYSTVYAHLQKYAGEIQEYVKDNQYQKETFEIELFPASNTLVVKKGDLIGYTGNSGSSGGPHLHFEIRDAASRPMNPLLFGIEIPDSKVPIVQSVFAYPLSNDAHVNDSVEPIKLRLSQQQDGSYKAETLKAFGKIGFGISTIDQQDGASNKNGVYKIKGVFNGEEKVSINFDKFSFDETRYLNRYIDYGYFKNNKSRIQKLFRESNNPLSIIKDASDGGMVTIENDYSSNYVIDVTDFTGNSIKVTIPIKGEISQINQDSESATNLDYIYSDQANSFTKGKFSVYIPADSFYEDTALKIDVVGDTLHLHEDVIPVHKNITISVDVSNYNESDLGKLFLGRLNYRNEPYYNTTYRKGDKLSTRTRTLGSYTLVSDLIPPTITPVNFDDGKWISKNSTLEIKIDDDLSGISNYRATINGKFILMEYEYKKDVLTYYFDDNIITDTENNLKLIVTDNVGNSTTFEATFFRK